MIYEYAVDPEVMSNLQICRAVLENFGPEYARLISDAPRHWLKKATNAINKIPYEELPDPKGTAIKRKLAKFKERGSLCRRPSTNDKEPSEEWINYIARIHDDYPFEAIYETNQRSFPVVTCDLENAWLDEDSKGWGKKPAKKVNRKAKDMIDAAMPMLKLSREVIFADRYINPDFLRYRNVLNELIKRTPSFNFGNGVSKLIIYYSDHDKMQEVLERRFSPWLPSGFKIQCFRFPKEALHKRLIITNIGCIDCEALDETTQDKPKNNADWYSEMIDMGLVEKEIFQKDLNTLKEATRETPDAFVEGKN